MRTELDAIARRTLELAQQGHSRAAAIVEQLARRGATVHLTPSLRIVVSGTSGLIDTLVTALLADAGHRVDRLVRRDSSRQPGWRSRRMPCCCTAWVARWPGSAF